MLAEEDEKNGKERLYSVIALQQTLRPSISFGVRLHLHYGRHKRQASWLRPETLLPGTCFLRLTDEDGRTEVRKVIKAYGAD